MTTLHRGECGCLVWSEGDDVHAVPCDWKPAHRVQLVAHGMRTGVKVVMHNQLPEYVRAAVARTKVPS